MSTEEDFLLKEDSLAPSKDADNEFFGPSARFVNEGAKRLYMKYIQTQKVSDKAVRENTLTAICDGQNVLLLCKGGSGKTYLIKEYIKSLPKEKQSLL